MELEKIVFKQVGAEDQADFERIMSDVTMGGADAGFNGFTYYADTVQFWQDNKAAIMDKLAQDAEGSGLSIIEMVEAFNCLNYNYDMDEVGEVLYGDDDNTQICNALAWYALETVAYQVVEA